MDDSRTQALCDEALHARASGDLPGAVALYEQLEEAEPERPEWPLHRAEILSLLGDRTGERVALVRSGELYAGSGRVVQALALERLARSIDPGQRAIADRLAALARPRGRAGADPGDSRARHAGDARPEPGAGGAPLESLRLAALMADAEPVAWSEASDAIARIPLDDDTPTASLADGEDEAPRVEAEPVGPDAAARTTFCETPLFGDLDAPGLAALAARARVVEIADGELLHRRGDATTGLYAVAHGSVVPFVEQTPEDGTAPIRREARPLEAGEMFGETALLSRVPHRVSLEARGATRLLHFEKAALADWIGQDPSRVRALLKLVRGRIVDRLIETHPLFASSSGEPRETLVRSFRLLEVEDGASVIEQGRTSRAVFVVVSGRLSVVRSDEDGEKIQAELECGEACGERSVLTGNASDVSAIACGRTWLLDWPAEELRSRLGSVPAS
ncbi:MAG: cyclic nucleotide-binding domain-containing protein [Myxococcota bacterium]